MAASASLRRGRARAKGDLRLAEPEARSGPAPQLAAQVSSERLSVANSAGAPATDFAAAVRLQQQPFEAQPIAVEFGEPGDRRAAGTVERGEEGPFGADACGAPHIVKGFEKPPHPVVPGTAFDSERALPDRRQHDLRRQDLARTRG